MADHRGRLPRNWAKLRHESNNGECIDLYFHAIGCYVAGSESAHIIFDLNRNPIIINTTAKFLFPLHANLHQQYKAQISHIIKNKIQIKTIDFSRGQAFCFSKRPLFFNKKLIGIIFEGQSILHSEESLYMTLKLKRTSKISAFKLSRLDALIIVALKFGYNASQAARIFFITQKAARSRIERLMLKFSVSSRDELIGELRSSVMISAVAEALFQDSFSMVIDDASLLTCHL